MDNCEPDVQPETSHDPVFITTEQAEQISFDAFGIRGQAESLYGDINQNIRLRTGDERGFVLKIAPDGSEDTSRHIQMQCALLEHLSTCDLRVKHPRVRLNKNGTVTEFITDAAGNTHLAWMLSFVEGELLDTVSRYDNELLIGLGQAVAAVDRALLDFQHPADQRYSHWDLGNALDLADALDHIEDERKFKIIADFLRGFEITALPRIDGLGSSVIHNDGGNQHNMLIGANPGDSVQVTGIIDFGDAVRTRTLFGLGITAAYASFGCDNVTEAIAEVAAGYNREMPLTETDIELLPWLMAARLAATVVFAAERLAKEPANRYAQVSAGPAWTRLEQLMQTDFTGLTEVVSKRLQQTD